jgi:hypothetical protein
MKRLAKAMLLALALATVGGMAPQALAKTTPQMGHKMTHKASKHTRAYSGKRRKNRTAKNETTTVKPGMRQGL